MKDQNELLKIYQCLENEEVPYATGHIDQPTSCINGRFLEESLYQRVMLVLSAVSIWKGLSEENALLLEVKNLYSILGSTKDENKPSPDENISWNGDE